jgi:hypothetical protein
MVVRSRITLVAAPLVWAPLGMVVRSRIVLATALLV